MPVLPIYQQLTEMKQLFVYQDHTQVVSSLNQFPKIKHNNKINFFR